VFGDVATAKNNASPDATFFLATDNAQEFEQRLDMRIRQGNDPPKTMDASGHRLHGQIQTCDQQREAENALIDIVAAVAPCDHLILFEHDLPSL